MSLLCYCTCCTAAFQWPFRRLDSHRAVREGLFQVDGHFVTDEDIAVANYQATNNSLDCTASLCYPDGNPESSFNSFGVSQGKGFAYYALDTYEVLWRCVFRDEATDKLNAIVNPNGDAIEKDVISMATQNEDIKAGYDIWHNLFGDLWTSRYFILGLGFGAPLVRASRPRTTFRFLPRHSETDG